MIFMFFFYFAMWISRALLITEACVWLQLYYEHSERPPNVVVSLQQNSLEWYGNQFLIFFVNPLPLEKRYMKKIITSIVIFSWIRSWNIISEKSFIFFIRCGRPKSFLSNFTQFFEICSNRSYLYRKKKHWCPTRLYPSHITLPFLHKLFL